MFLFRLIFIFAVVYGCHAEQKLECPYAPEHKDKPRVWCKMNTDNQSCCTGFSFLTQNGDVNDDMRVSDDGKAFTMSVKRLSQGDGVYWCGFKDGTNTIIKRGEIDLKNPMDSVWYIARWLVFALLLLSVILTHACCNRKTSKD